MSLLHVSATHTPSSGNTYYFGDGETTALYTLSLVPLGRRRRRNTDTVAK
jgi:hypothetical protein